MLTGGNNSYHVRYVCSVCSFTNPLAAGSEAGTCLVCMQLNDFYSMPKNFTKQLPVPNHGVCCGEVQADTELLPRTILEDQGQLSMIWSC